MIRDPIIHGAARGTSTGSSRLRCIPRQTETACGTCLAVHSTSFRDANWRRSSGGCR
jgi:hypothetical protein